MSQIYSVYEHPTRGQWGHTALSPEGAVHTAELQADGSLVRASLNPLKLGPQLQQRMRAGYRKVAQAKYLLVTHGGERGQFCAHHPDLAMVLSDAQQLLYYMCVPQGTDMQQLADAWRNRLVEGKGNCHDQETWLAVVAQAQAYVPVPVGDAYVALLVGQWAREHAALVVSRVSDPPALAPADSRHAWREFLNETVPLRAVDQALADLGWPLSEAFAAIAPKVETTTAPGEADEWLVLAQQASF